MSLHEGRAVIAVLAPRDAAAAPEALPLAEALGATLAGVGYSTAILGAGGAAEAAGSAALTVGGRVIAFSSPQMPVSDLDREPGEFEIRSSPSYFGALESALDISDAVIVLDPSLGSLAVLLHVWSYGDSPDGPFRPLVLLGEAWPKIVGSIADAASLDRRTRAMLTFAATSDEAVEALRYYVQPD